ncbi:hypothetical protein JOB18_032059 [Solea senegalensis]|uniref:Uncharacterized protein n=1 Tax=Solea senegalensis TaxID=28829 RepID=A0AAV6SU09_SOLSE|nr:hypothetical protein JOB18_032059 [Solea senegalensis]
MFPNASEKPHTLVHYRQNREDKGGCLLSLCSSLRMSKGLRPLIKYLPSVCDSALRSCGGFQSLGSFVCPQQLPGVSAAATQPQLCLHMKNKLSQIIQVQPQVVYRGSKALNFMDKGVGKLIKRKISLVRQVDMKMMEHLLCNSVVSEICNVINGRCEEFPALTYGS